jgi:hypothetical protein
MHRTNNFPAIYFTRHNPDLGGIESPINFPVKKFTISSISGTHEEGMKYHENKGFGTFT